MIIFISPSKTFKSTKVLPKTEIIFTKETESLNQQIILFSKEALKNGLKLSASLTNEVYDYYHKPHEKYAAASLYDGVLYKKLDYETIFHSPHSLYIFSAYYGLLRATDGISPYRLDFNQTLIKGLYAYWRAPINIFLSTLKDELLINLASAEFSKLFKSDLPVITIDFEGVHTRLTSVLLKQMRGLMARHLLLNAHLKSLKDIKEINLEGFTYSPEKSTANKLIFTK